LFHVLEKKHGNTNRKKKKKGGKGFRRGEPQTKRSKQKSKTASWSATKTSVRGWVPEKGRPPRSSKSQHGGGKMVKTGPWGLLRKGAALQNQGGEKKNPPFHSPRSQGKKKNESRCTRLDAGKGPWALEIQREKNDVSDASR